MNNLGKTFFLLFLAATMLASCGGSPSTPTLQGAEIMQTAVSSAGTRLAESLPTGTPRSAPYGILFRPAYTNCPRTQLCTHH